MADEKFDIMKESLKCHHILFNKDVTLSRYDSDQQCFQLSHVNLSIKRARLNGLVVDLKTIESNNHFWLDDGTSVIRAIIPSKILSRRNGYSIEIGSNITVFGEIIQKNDEIMIVCGGFKLEEDCIAEIYHWLKVIQDRPTQNNTSAPHNMFYSLSSFPSPNRLLDADFMNSPVEDISKNAAYLWSPNHKYATSTPLRLHQQHAINHSPLRPTATEKQEDVDFDEFGDEDDDFGGLDLALIESNARDELNNKRKRSLSE